MLHLHAGAPPKDCEWCPVQGIYIASEATKPDDNYIRSEDKRKWVLQSPPPPLGQGAADALIVAAAAPAPAQKKQKTTQRRKYQPEWKTKYLQGLVCCAIGVTFSTTAAIDFIAAPPLCPGGGAECQGCNMCSLMYCSECMIQGTPGIRGSPNPFVQGCSNFHVSSIQNHRKCYHPNQIQGQTDVTEGILQQCEKQKLDIIDLMKNALFLAQHHIAFVKFPALLELGRDLGLHLTHTYCNDMACRDFVLSIAAIVREDINADARASPVIGLMIDESTDVANINEMIVYIRILRSATRVFETVFWAIVEVDEATGIGLANTVKQLFKQRNVPINKVRCMATDGASAMTGPHSGCVQCIRESAGDNMLGVHCIAHRQALACKDAMEGNECAEWFDGCLHNICHYHTKSPKRQKHLEALLEVQCIKALRLVTVAKTRWLSRQAAVHRVLHLWPGLVQEFEEDARAKCAVAGAINQYTKTGKFLYCLITFCDILTILAGVSLAFQSKRVAFRSLVGTLNGVVDLLTSRYIDRFVGCEKFQEVKALVKAAKKRGSRTAVYRGVEFSISGMSSVKKNVSKFARDLVTGLKIRLDPAQMDIVAALDVFDVDRLRAQPLPLPEAYYLADSQKLIQFYGTGQQDVEPERVRIELPLLLHELRRAADQTVWPDDLEALHATRDAFYAEAIKNTAALPNAKFLLYNYLCVCLSTVCCECGFSDVSQTKTAQSNRMGVDTLEARMMVTQHQKAAAAVIVRAFEHWKNKRALMPQRSHVGKAGRKPKSAPTATLADVHAEAAQEAREVSISDEEVESETEEVSELVEKYGEYKVPEGCRVLAPPAATHEEWVGMCKASWWKGKRLAHLWDNWGWADSTYKKKSKGKYEFQYVTGDEIEHYEHKLNIADYGVKGLWVVTARDD